MTEPILCSKFSGLTIKVIPRRGNPCARPDDAINNTPGHWCSSKLWIYVDFVSVKPTWDARVKQRNDVRFIEVMPDDIIMDVKYICEREIDRISDVVEIYTRSLRTREEKCVSLSMTQSYDFVGISHFG
jgi:hypothetical protein